MIIVVLNAVGIAGLIPKALISTYLSFFPVVVGMVKGFRSPEQIQLDYSQERLAAYGLPVAPTAITQRAAFAYALNDGRAVTEYEPDGKAADELRSVNGQIEFLLKEAARSGGRLRPATPAKGPREPGR